MVTHAAWKSGTWMDPDMLTGGKAWAKRQMVQVNKWSSRLDEWRVREFMRTIEDSLREEFDAQFSQCMYGRQASSLKLLAAVCANDRLSTSALSSVLAQDTKLAEVTTFPGVPEAVGNLKSSNINIKSNTFTAESKVSISESAETRTGSTKNSQTSSSVAFAGKYDNHFTTRSSATINDAECWSKVKNSNDKLVGQLRGNCVKVGTTASIVQPLELCLAIKSTIKTNSLYTVDDFVLRTGTANAYVYTPQGVTISNSGTHLCASVTQANAYFCPALIASNWASRTSHVGSDACQTMLVLTGQAAATTPPSPPSGPSPVSTTPAATADSSSGNSNTGAIVGGVVGGVAGAMLLVGGVWYYKTHYYHPTDKESNAGQPQGEAAPTAVPTASTANVDSQAIVDVPLSVPPAPPVFHVTVTTTSVGESAVV